MKRIHKNSVIIVVAILIGMGLFTVVAASSQASPISSPVQNPANCHYYEAVSVPGGIIWQDAKVAAESLIFMGYQGHLVTITSQQEQDFIVTTFPQAIIPGGLGYWIGGFQPPGSPEPDGGWEWVTGEPFVYTNWMTNEPNNAPPGEDAIHLDGRQIGGSPLGAWNDVPSYNNMYGIPGYIVEYDIPCPLEAIVDIKPGSDPNTINMKSKGRWIIATVELPEEYQCNQINANTILWDGAISPVRDPKYGWAKSEDSYCVDENGNGVLERLLKFDRSDIEILYGPGEHTVTISGELFCGMPFEGSDTIRVIDPT